MTRVFKNLLLSSIATSVCLGTTACGDIGQLLNDPNVQALAQKYGLDLYLGQEINGEAQVVTQADVEAITADGKPVNYQVQGDGHFVVDELPEGATELEVKYAGVDQPIKMPLEKDQVKDGKLIQKGVTRLEKAQGKLSFKEHHDGYDFDRDGEFDEDRPQIVHDKEQVIFHDPKAKIVKRFDFNGPKPFDFKRPPKEEIKDGDFFLPIPRTMCKHKIDENGVLMIPNPQGGEPHMIPKGKYELLPGGAVRVTLETFPAKGKLIGPPPCRLVQDKPMPPQDGQKPPIPPQGDMDCKFPLAPEGGIMVALPDGTPRVLKEGEFELVERNAVRVLKEGAPDFGKVVPPPCQKPPMPPQDGNQAPPEGEQTAPPEAENA